MLQSQNISKTLIAFENKRSDRILNGASFALMVAISIHEQS